MEFNHLPRASPNALATICAPLVYDGNTRFHKLDRIFRAHTNTTAAVITLSRDNMNHQWRISCHIHLT